MGLLSTVWAWIYQLIVQTHLLYHLYPVLRSYFLDYIINSSDSGNHKLVDGKGKTLCVSKLGDRIYPAFRVSRLKTYADSSIRDSDVLLCGFPKTGAHWVHEILHMLVRGKAELTRYGKGLEGMVEFLPDFLLDSLPSPRVLNTHFLFEDLPHQVKTKRIKIVLTVRNPKDVVVSYYNHTKNLQIYKYDGDFDDFFKLWIEGKTEYGSYFDYILSFDRQLTNPTTNEILLVDYDDMRIHPVQHVKRIAQFLDVPIEDQFAKEVANLCSFDSLKEKRAAENYNSKLFRKGEVGDWKNWLSAEQSTAIDRIWKERMTGCSYQPRY